MSVKKKNKVFYRCCGLFVLSTLLICSDIMAQRGEIDHWETVIFSYENWKFFVGNSDPGNAWRSLSFDDSSWSEGAGGIGYGDDDDGTDISQEPGFQVPYSLFIRKKFTIVDTSDILVGLLNIDYDDAFVAYINDVEIARAGIGIPGDHPTFDQPAAELHEAVMYQGQDPDYFQINYTVLKECLTEGENQLALQIHNFSNTSSDMSSTTFFSVGLADSSTTYSPVPDWFEPPEIFVSSNLPIVVINTGGLPIINDPRVFVDMGIIDNGPGNRNYVGDPFNGYNCKINIELRGSSTLGFPKKSYLFETQDSLGQNNNVSLLGLPVENDWILYAPYTDKSLMRNAVTYQLGNEMGKWAPHTRYCELILNNEYRGIYLLMEKIKRDKNRVDIATLLETDIAGDELTGGYIIRIDKTDQPNIVGWRSYPNPEPPYPDYSPLFYQYYYPKAENLVLQQENYIQDFIYQMESTLNSSWFKDPVDGYRQYIDAGSVIDHFIMRELAKEIDSYLFSTFMYKEKDSDGGRLHIGPIWDFNLGYGNANYGTSIRPWDTEGWVYNKGGRIYFWRRLFEDPLVVNRLKCQWEELRQGPFHADSIMSLVDSLSLCLEEAQVRNFNRWKILGNYVWPNYYVGDTWEEEVVWLKNWILTRLAWMDNNIPGNCNPLSERGLEIISDISVFPSPFRDEVFFKIFTNQTGLIRIRIFSVVGKEIKVLTQMSEPFGESEMSWKISPYDDISVPQGIYLYSIELDDARIGSGKLVKQ